MWIPPTNDHKLLCEYNSDYKLVSLYKFLSRENRRIKSIAMTQPCTQSCTNAWEEYNMNIKPEMSFTH